MNRKKAILTSVMMSGAVLLLSMFTISNTVSAHGSKVRERQIISVQIEEGDSLWSIAEEYYTGEYKSVRNYVKEIKSTNGLTSDTIHAGCYLIIPCYVEVTE